MDKNSNDQGKDGSSSRQPGQTPPQNDQVVEQVNNNTDTVAVNSEDDITVRFQARHNLTASDISLDDTEAEDNLRAEVANGYRMVTPSQYRDFSAEDEEALRSHSSLIEPESSQTSVSETASVSDATSAESILLGGTVSSSSQTFVPRPSAMPSQSMPTEFTNDQIFLIIRDYFLPEKPSPSPSNSSSSWDASAILGEEMSPIYDRSRGVFPGCALPISNKPSTIKLSVSDRYFLGQRLGDLMDFAADSNETRTVLWTLNSIRLKMKLPKEHCHYPPAEIPDKFITLMDSVLNRIEQDTDDERRAYRLEILLELILFYDEEYFKIHTIYFDLSYMVEKFLVEINARTDTSEPFVARQFKALLELKEWNDRVGHIIHGESYNDMIGISLKIWRPAPPVANESDDQVEEEPEEDQDDDDEDNEDPDEFQDALDDDLEGQDNDNNNAGAALPPPEFLASGDSIFITVIED